MFSSQNNRRVMSFGEALIGVAKGGLITKLEWGDETIYGFIDNGILKLHRSDGTEHNWIVSDGDIVGEDFIIL